jgi:hypothetical protein
MHSFYVPCANTHKNIVDRYMHCGNYDIRSWIPYCEESISLIGHAARGKLNPLCGLFCSAINIKWKDSARGSLKYKASGSCSCAVVYGWMTVLYRSFHIRGSFEKFVDSVYYSESELCGGAMTVSVSKYLPWQAMRLLQRSTHFSKTCCRPLITSKFLTSELPLHGWKSPGIAWSEIWTVWRMFCWGSTDPLFQTEHRIQFRSRSMRFLGFSRLGYPLC